MENYNYAIEYINDFYCSHANLTKIRIVNGLGKKYYLHYSLIFVHVEMLIRIFFRMWLSGWQVAVVKTRIKTYCENVCEQVNVIMR